MNVPVPDDGIVTIYLCIEMSSSVVGIILKQVKVCFSIKQVVDSYNFCLILVFAMDGTKNLSADTAKTVDANSYFTHVRNL